MYQCQNCGGTLKFDIATQQMKCEFCDSNFDPYIIKKDTDALEDNLYQTNALSCPQCGATLLCTDEEATSFCSYCGSPTILSQRICKEKRPKYIIPFKITKDQCKQMYAKKIKGSLFAPDELKDPIYIDGFRGIYMPFYSYRFSQHGHVRLKGEQSNRTGDYIITKHYDISGDISADYDGISFDASSSFFDSISEEIVPFKTAEQQEFTPSILSGFYADTADIKDTVYENDAANQALDITYKKLSGQSEVSKYSAISSLSKANMQSCAPVKKEGVDSTLYPVWFLSYRKNERIAYAAINGQTGKVVMDVPIDMKKYGIVSAITAIILFIIFNLSFTLKPTELLTFSTIMAFLSGFFYIKDMKAIFNKNNNIGDKGLAEKSDDTEKKKKFSILSQDNENKFGFWSTLFAIILSLGVAIVNPVADIYYYLGAIASFVGSLFTVVAIMKNYNILCTRKLPQFDKQGGDDLA